MAEDLTSETFLAAVDGVRRGAVPDLTVAWLIGVARHKLVDHWRRRERDERKLRALDHNQKPAGPTRGTCSSTRWSPTGPWPTWRPSTGARSPCATSTGSPSARSASCLGRTEGATEALLVRAKAAFRARYEGDADDARGGGAMTDPFDALSTPVEPQTPRPAFARALRARVVAELGLDPTDALPTIDLPTRSRPMSTTTAPATPAIATALVPYLAITGASRAIDWYVEALGAVEQLRVVGDDGRVGHAELLSATSASCWPTSTPSTT